MTVLYSIKKWPAIIAEKGSDFGKFVKENFFRGRVWRIFGREHPVLGFSRNEIGKLFLHLTNSNWNGIRELVQENLFEGYIWKLLGFEHQSKLCKVIQRFNKNLIEMEQTEVKVFDCSTQEVREEAINYRKSFKIFFQTADKIKQFIKGREVLHPELKEMYCGLQLNMMGMRYRLGKENGGCNPFSEEELREDPVHQKYQKNLYLLTKLALHWKKKQELAVNTSFLNEREKLQLSDAAKFDKWIHLLENSKKHQDDFFKWILRDGNAPEIFIKYRHTQEILKRSYCSGSLGRIRRPGTEEPLKIQDVETQVKGVKNRILTMPLYSGRFDQFESDKQDWVNILNPKTILNFKDGNYQLPLSEVWKESSKKNERDSIFNICKWGLINFHPVLGKWDNDQKKYVMPSMNKDNWTQYIPPGDVYSNAELKARYGNKIKDKQIFLKICSTRQSPNLNVLKCHGFWQLFIYMGHDKWKVLDLGAYASEFQQGVVDGLVKFCATLPRVFTFLDQNGGYSHRQKAAYPLFPEPEKGKEYINHIWKFSQSKGVFQFAGENCSCPVQKSVESESLNFFKMRVTKGNVGFLPLDHTLAFLERCPALIRKWGLFFVHHVFGSWRMRVVEQDGKMVKYSVANYFKDTEDMYNPAYLHHQIERAHKTEDDPFATGELSWGNLDFNL